MPIIRILSIVSDVAPNNFMEHILEYCCILIINIHNWIKRGGRRYPREGRCLENERRGRKAHSGITEQAVGRPRPSCQPVELYDSHHILSSSAGDVVLQMVSWRWESRPPKELEELEQVSECKHPRSQSGILFTLSCWICYFPAVPNGKEKPRSKVIQWKHEKWPS